MQKSQRQRYVTAVILVAALAVLFAINNPFLIWLFLGVALFLGVLESIKLFGISHSKKWLLVLKISVILLWVLTYFNSKPIFGAIFFAMILVSALAYKMSSLKIVLPLFYPSIGFLAIFAIYRDFGLAALLWLVIVIAVNDTAAYFGGRIFGKTAFSKASPNKTLEGFVIGLLIALSIGSILGIGMLKVHFIASLALSIAIALLGVFGDLFESFLKRCAQLKDSGGILPGHGGILDRFDATLFGASGLFYLLHFFK